MYISLLFFWSLYIGILQGSIKDALSKCPLLEVFHKVSQLLLETRVLDYHHLFDGEIFIHMISQIHISEMGKPCLCQLCCDTTALEVLSSWHPDFVHFTIFAVKYFYDQHCMLLRAQGISSTHLHVFGQEFKSCALKPFCDANQSPVSEGDQMIV